MYIYYVAYKEDESLVAKLELSSLFKEEVIEKIIISDYDYPIDRCVYFKAKLKVMEKAANLKELIDSLKEKEYHIDDYKVEYIKNEFSQFDYQQRLTMCSAVGYEILGEFNLRSPRNLLGLIDFKGYIYFGRLTYSNKGWMKYKNKPYSFSTALPVRLARSLVNIADPDLKYQIIDPCCGVGTVVLEALDLNANIACSDASFPNIKSTRKNLEYYNYHLFANYCRIEDIKEVYDVAIIDLPYGHYAKISYQAQLSILKAASKIANQLVLVTSEVFDQELNDLGYEFVRVHHLKQSFKRYIYRAKLKD